MGRGGSTEKHCGAVVDSKKIVSLNLLARAFTWSLHVLT